LGEYLVKGFTMDDERLKNPPGRGLSILDRTYAGTRPVWRVDGLLKARFNKNNVRQLVKDSL